MKRAGSDVRRATPGTLPNRQPVRVLIANDRLGRAPNTLHGAGRLMIEWNRGFRATSVRATSCILRAPDEVGRQLAAEGVNLVFFGDRRLSPASVLKFVRLIRKERIDVLHLQGYGSTALGRIAGILTSTPAVIHLHSCYGEDGSYPWYARFADRLLRPFTARAIAVSQPIRAFCIEQLGYAANDVQVIHNPVPTYGFAPPSEEEISALRSRYELVNGAPTIGTISRLDPVKGIDVLIAAFHSVLEVVPEARLLIVGDGSEKQLLEDQARQLGVSRSVSFAGFRRDVAAHLRLFSVTAIPSVFQEPCPMSALESLAAGVPVIGSRTGGLPELVDDGVSGILVEPGEAEPLAEALTAVLTQGELLSDLRRGALGAAEQFSLRAHLGRLEQLYREVAFWGRTRQPALTGGAEQE